MGSVVLLFILVICLCCVFLSSSFVLCSKWCQCLWIVHIFVPDEVASASATDPILYQRIYFCSRWGGLCKCYGMYESSIFSFMCSVLKIIVGPLVIFLLAITSCVLRFTASNYPFPISKLFVVPVENHRPWASNWKTLSLAAASRAHPFCNLQSRARTHSVLAIGLYELLGNPTI
jgi:hypothetical protein